MATSPPSSPSPHQQRPLSAMVRASRSSSRMSLGSKYGGAAGESRASDEDGKTAVKVGACAVGCERG